MFVDATLAALPLMLVGLGVILVFRVLGEIDLSVDAVFTSGAAITALTIVSGRSPWLGLAVATLVGAGMGLLTLALHRGTRVPYLLASLIVLTGFYSVNLRIFGGSGVSLLRHPSIADALPLSGDAADIAALALIVVVALIALFLFLHSALGLALRAAGQNPQMARANGIDTHGTLTIGVMIAGALVAAGGSLQAQVQGFADITMGIGMLIVGISVVFLGELAFPPSGRIAPLLLSVVLGAYLQNLVVIAALRSGLPPSDLRLVTAAILVLAVLLARVLRGRRPVGAARRGARRSAVGRTLARFGGRR